jgi:hypothetical protein
MMDRISEQEMFEQMFLVPARRQGKIWAIRMQYAICEKKGTLDSSYCITPYGIVTMRQFGIDNKWAVE